MKFYKINAQKHNFFKYFLFIMCNTSLLYKSHTHIPYSDLYCFCYGRKTKCHTVKPYFVPPNLACTAVSQSSKSGEEHAFSFKVDSILSMATLRHFFRGIAGISGNYNKFKVLFKTKNEFFTFWRNLSLKCFG